MGADKNMRAFFLLGVLMLSSGAVLAQAGGEPVSALRAEFMALDRNRDGLISKVEALGNGEIQKRLSAFDRDKDGLLSEAEYTLAVEDNNKRILHDSTITARVKAALFAEKGIPSLQIAVDTYEGEVRLTGFVSAPEIVSRAGRVTATVNGVRTVHNDITVK